MPTNGGVSDVEILGTSVPDLRGDKTGPEENLVSRKMGTRDGTAVRLNGLAGRFPGRFFENRHVCGFRRV